MGIRKGHLHTALEPDGETADTALMIETSTPDPLKPPAGGIAAEPVRPGHFPVELETEFAEMQAAAPTGGILPGLLGAGLLFHVLLISERALLLLPPRAFALRGGPVTVALLLLLLAPAPFRQKEVGRACMVLFAVLLVAVLLARVPFTGASQLLPIQTGVALLLLVMGILVALPRQWAGILTISALIADGASLFLGPAAQTTGLPVIAESMWAPGFAAALLLIIAGTRQNEARRDFLLLRQAAFAGVPASSAEVAATSPHLDPETGVANRLAFDMRFRASWEQAAARRHSVALLFFSIDDLAEHKREKGFRFAEQLQGQVATLLKDSLRRSDDMVARFDNQHFVVMLPGVGTDGATQIAERLRGCIEEMAVFMGQKRHSATVTVGASSMRAKRGVPREKLVDGAVHALDQARSTGTNIVCVEGRGCIPRMS